jgi:hypothetical protein
VIESEPTARVVVEYVATPELLRVPVPRLVVPCMKFTVPVGVVSPEVTVAVKVTLAPKEILLELAARPVVVAAGVVLLEPPLPEGPLPVVGLAAPPPQPHRQPAIASVAIRPTIFIFEPPISIGNLLPGQKFRWRVVPKNSYCTLPSPPQIEKKRADNSAFCD